MFQGCGKCLRWTGARGEDHSHDGLALRPKTVLVLVSAWRSFRLWPDGPLLGGMDRWYTFLPSTDCSGGSAVKVDRFPCAAGQGREDCDASRGVSRTGSEGAPALIEGRRPDAPKPPAFAAPSKPDVRGTVGRWYGTCFLVRRRGASPRGVLADIVAKAEDHGSSAAEKA